MEPVPIPMIDFGRNLSTLSRVPDVVVFGVIPVSEWAADIRFGNCSFLFENLWQRIIEKCTVVGHRLQDDNTFWVRLQTVVQVARVARRLDGRKVLGVSVEIWVRVYTEADWPPGMCPSIAHSSEGRFLRCDASWNPTRRSAK